MSYLCLFYVYECCDYICAHALCAFLVPMGAGEGIGSPGTTVTNDCKLLCEWGEPSMGSLQEQKILLTTQQSVQLRYEILSKTT